MRSLKLLLAAVLVVVASPALAEADPIGQGFYTFVWEMPHAPTGTGADAPWPQTLVAYTQTDGPDLGAFDSEIPDCGFFQIDVYKIDSDGDVTKLAGIVEAGTLDWPEDSSIYYSSKFAEGTECQTTTTSTAPTTTTTVEATTTTVGTTTTENSTTSTIPESTTTTLGQSTTSLQQGSTTTPASSTTAPTPTTPTLEQLPFTGAPVAGYVGAALLLILAGWGVIEAARR